jgi:deoxyribonuclease V
MIACIDVHYAEDAAGSTTATAACVLIPSFRSATATVEHVRTLADVAQYVPGQFYKRELPCVLAVLELVEQPLERIVIDGYVVLDAAGTLGMGGHLFEALGRRVPVVGVAKNRFGPATRPEWRPAGSQEGGVPENREAILGGAFAAETATNHWGALEVYRGGSKRPLFVTALGVDPQAAANDVQQMHGEHRLPTMLKRVDRLCRDGR